MCFRKAKWQREVVNDHKFDFVCIDDFKKNDFIIRIKYIWLYLVVIKTILVYVADLWTAGILLIFNRWSSTINPSTSISISKWVYVGCIFISFLLLIWDWKKAKAIIASRDISYAFTSIIASRYYTLRSYAHHCFFCEINRQKRKVDRLAFFAFFTFKGMKKLLLAEAPRQYINATTLYKLVQTNITKDWMNFGAYGNDPVERLAMILMAFSLLAFVMSATKLAFAFILYIPLLFHIRGNLKEYCCHKIDKRINELLKKQSAKRKQKLRMVERALAKGDVNRLKKKDILLSLNHQSRRKPTLPTLHDDDNINYDYPDYSRRPSPDISIYNQPPDDNINYDYPDYPRRPSPDISIYNQPPPEPIRPPPPPPYLNNNRLQPSPYINVPHDLSLRPPSPHGFTYNSGPQPQPSSAGLSRIHYRPNNITVPIPVSPVSPVRYASPQNERFNPNPNYYNNNHNNQYNHHQY